MRTIEEICKGEDRNDILIKASLDFGFWMTRVMGNEYTWFHDEWFKAFHNFERSAIVAPRGHGKTYVLGVCYSLWYSFFNENKKFTIISKTKEQAIEIMDEIKKEIYDNELIQNLQPKNRSMPWTKTTMYTSTKSRIQCKPYTDTARGGHVDRVLADEVAYYEDKNTFNLVVSPMLANKRGHIMAISTPQSEGDLIMELYNNKMYNPPKGYSKLYKAVDIPEGMNYRDGKVMWETRYDMDFLMDKMDEIGKLKFEREYMCNPIATGTSIFPANQINAVLDDTITLYIHPNDIKDGKKEDDKEKEKDEFLRKPLREIYIGVDFGLSDAYEAGWTVIIVLEKDIDGTLVIRDIDRSKGLHPTIIDQRIKTMREKWMAKQVWVDESTFGKNYLLKLLQEQIPARGVTFTRENRNEILLTLMKYFETRKLKIPAKEDVRMPLVENLIKELSAMSSGETQGGLPTFMTTAMFDDMVMSLALAVYGADQNKATLVDW